MTNTKKTKFIIKTIIDRIFKSQCVQQKKGIAAKGAIKLDNLLLQQIYTGAVQYLNETKNRGVMINISKAKSFYRFLL